jgi:hypothetical protein
MRNLPSAKISIAEKLLQEAVRFLSPWCNSRRFICTGVKRGSIGTIKQSANSAKKNKGAIV